jgi:hypothetical protein
MNIIKDYGWCKIFTDEGKSYISFDAGEIVVKMTTYEISEEQRSLAVESETLAEKIAREVAND